VCIHNNDPNNPHVHIMTTVRPLNPDGTWQHKTEKEYLCVRNGEERSFTAMEYRTAQAEGWEKQYQYLVGKKKVYMPPSAAEVQGLERTSKNPKCTRYGRQNPISERWNSEEQLIVWREKWAECMNRHPAQYDIAAKVDHRSHADRGLDEQPTVHEGIAANTMEKRRVTADRSELNRQIRADNSLVRQLKAVIRRLTEAIQNVLPTLARTLETIRRDMILISSHIQRTEEKSSEVEERLEKIQADYDNYIRVRRRIAQKLELRKAVRLERDKTPLLNISRRLELSSRMTALAKEIDALKAEEERWFQHFGQRDSEGMKAVQKRIAEMEKSVREYGETSVEYIGKMDESRARFAEVKREAGRFDPDKLIAERINARREIAEDTQRTVNDILGRHDMLVYRDIVDLVDEELGEENMIRQHIARRNNRERQEIRETDRAAGSRKQQEEEL
ncbi:MAG: MobA/MobL family protein, partial [Clostridia bacterium]|nr:MobA/MobL family protein [Clostridia bacterium]